MNGWCLTLLQSGQVAIRTCLGKAANQSWTIQDGLISSDVDSTCVSASSKPNRPAPPIGPTPPPGPSPGPAPSPGGMESIPVDLSVRGPVLQGLGGVSGGTGARLLYDYPEAQRSAMLDVLFKPGAGAGLQVH